ncbi:MAG: hypothetical protein KAI57_04540 [Candidatus Pacebacteria bacterium]|nr:hypothetical protein [Candidatus Paceibacterota bacterium]
MEKEKKGGININYIVIIILFSALALNLLASSFNFFKANGIAAEIVQNIEEEKRPANLQITIIKDSSCSDCFSVNAIIEKIKSDNVNIEAEDAFERTDARAQELIEKYAIEKLPAFIIIGEINKNSSLAEAWGKIGEIIDGAIVFKSPAAPYVQASSGEIRGKVKLTIIVDESCTNCVDVMRYKGLSKQMGMDVEEEITVEYNSVEGKRIVRENNIKLIPTIVIEGDIQAYSVDDLKKFGDVVDNVFVLTQIQPPYINAANGRLMGKIDFTILSDKSCSECYDTVVYDNIIKQFGLFVKNKKTVDINSANGKYLINKYKIEDVPTIVMTGDVEVYNKPSSVWSGIGTTENNGTYVVRKAGVEQLGVYKNLVSGEVIGIEGN